MSQILFLLLTITNTLWRAAYATNTHDGIKSANISDFTCRTFDYHYMVCAFSMPKNITVTPKLIFSTQLPRRNGDNRNIFTQNYIQECELHIEGKQCTCNLTENDVYNPSHELYNFTLIMNSGSDTFQQNFLIDQSQNVIPDIFEFNISNVSAHGCSILWKMPQWVHYKWLQVEMQIHSPHYNDVKIYQKRRNHEYSLDITDLPYAYYNYNVSIRLRVNASLAPWSEWFMHSIVTLAVAPEVPPTVDVSSFYLNATHIRLLWLPTPTYHKNGSHFQYIISQVGKDKKPIKTRATDKPSAIFEWEYNHRFEFDIRSSNEKGMSKRKSFIIAPCLSKTYNDRSPRWIRNVYHATNRTYTLSWEAPIITDELINYIVFLCQPKSEVSKECDNLIGFEYLENDVFQYSTNAQEQPMVLAVAAYYPDFYTGMHWSTCIADASSDLMKLEPEIVNKTWNTMKIQWTLENVCISIVKGYQLKYCLVADISHCAAEVVPECLYEDVIISIDKNANEFLITDLRPYSTYRVEMHMFSNLKKGPVSDRQYVQTLETAPSAPRQLTYRNITSNSVTISWLIPEEINGNIISYIVLYNSEMQTVQCNRTNGVTCHRNSTIDRHISFTLTKLLSFTNYTICVRARTVSDSPSSNCVYFRTLIGYPSSPLDLNYDIKQNILLSWKPPLVPAGRVEYYEISIVTWYKNIIKNQKTARVLGETTCGMEKPSCINNDFHYTITVSAINVAYGAEIDWQLSQKSIHKTNGFSNDNFRCIGYSHQNGQKIAFGHLENSLEYKSENVTVLRYICGADKESSALLKVSVVLIIALPVVTILFLVIYSYFRNMSSIECRMPPGLITNANMPLSDINLTPKSFNDKNYERINTTDNRLSNNEDGKLLLPQTL